MIEVYKNTAESISFKLYAGGQRVNSDTPVTLSVTDSDGEVLVASAPAATTTPDGFDEYSYILGLNVTNEERELKVVWNYTILGQSGQRIDKVEVVTPYVTPEEIYREYPQLASKTYDEIKGMERRVRKIIEDICNQSFGSRLKTVTIYGTDTYSLRLGERLARIDTVSSNGIPINLTQVKLRTTEDGYNLYRWHEDDYYDIKRDVYYSVFPGYTTYFKSNYYYTITGLFGWETVPNEINLAAKLLIGDLFCNENQWRQKGLKSVRAADWRFEFSDTAFTGTGNAEVDRLLSRFVHNNMVIL